MWRKHQSSQ